MGNGTSTSFASQCNLRLVTRNRKLSSKTVIEQWNPDHQCKDGYRGPLCMLCDDGYVLIGTNCEVCEEDPDFIGACIFLLSSALLLFGVSFVVLARTKSHLEEHDSDTEERDHFRDILKILISYMQITSVMTLTYSSITWPKSFKSYSEGMGVINFDVAFIMPVASCSLSLPYHQQLYLHLSSPILFFLAIQGALALTLLLRMQCGEKNTKERRSAQSNKSQALFLMLMQFMCASHHNCIFLYHLILFFSLQFFLTFFLTLFFAYFSTDPSLTTKVFSVFRCFRIEGLGNFLRMDFSTECGSKDHSQLVHLGIAAMVLYTFCFPVYLFFDLKRTVNWHHEKIPPPNKILTADEKKKYEEHLFQHHQVKMRLGSLYHSYEKEYWWYEILFIFQKMILVGALGVVEQGSPTQLLLAFLIAAFFLLMVIRTAPFESDHHDTLSFMTSICMTLTLFAAFAKSLDEIERRRKHFIEDQTLGKMLVVANVVPFAFAIFITFQRMWGKRKGMAAHLKRTVTQKIYPLKKKSMTEENAKRVRAWEMSATPEK